MSRPSLKDNPGLKEDPLFDRKSQQSPATWRSFGARRRSGGGAEGPESLKGVPNTFLGSGSSLVGPPR